MGPRLDFSVWCEFYGSIWTASTHVYLEAPTGEGDERGRGTTELTPNLP